MMRFRAGGVGHEPTRNDTQGLSEDREAEADHAMVSSNLDSDDGERHAACVFRGERSRAVE
jgi:hypothetical protein